MFTPAVANYVTQFYALGNTPAVDLTRVLPHGVDADVLLLGCGDIRNILFTANSQKGLRTYTLRISAHLNTTDIGKARRRLDFTCCDINPAILARNAFLFSLVAADDLAVEVSTAWSIYYEFILDDHAASLVQTHIGNMLDASQSLEVWHQSPYSHLLSFCDEGSLRLVRDSWISMSSKMGVAKSKTAFEKELQRTRDYQKFRFGGDGVVLTGLRSASPTALLAMQSGELSKANEQFWKRGTFSESPADIPNPLFSGTISENNILHYGTDPILGFHLATAFVNLAPTSPLRIEDSSGGSSLRVVIAAKNQFEEWILAFRAECKQGLKIRLIIADALTFCHILSTRSGDDNAPTNVYRQQI